MCVGVFIGSIGLCGGFWLVRELEWISIFDFVVVVDGVVDFYVCWEIC